MMVLSGCAIADRGVDPTFETQGIRTSTTIIAVGNFESHTDFAAQSVDGNPGVMPVPPLAGDEAYYTASYSADTMSLGTGIINFDRTFVVDTSAQVLGGSNIEAEMLLGYYGIDGGRVVSSEAIMIDGAANPTATGAQVACPFATAQAGVFPAYCNRASAGSSIDMTVASVRTESNARFIMTSADFPVELNHNIRVTDYAGIPSQGMASAFMDVLIQEARSGQGAGGGNPAQQSERIEFHERTSIDGEITLFERLQHYESGPVR